MEAESVPCPMCGKLVKPGINFCGQCGYSLTGSSPPTNAAKPVSSRPPRRAFAGTMVGMPAVNAPAGGSDAPPDPSEPAAPAMPAAAVPAQPAASGHPKPSKGGVPQRTMLGMPAVTAPAAASAKPDKPAAAPAQSVKSHRTMLGMPQAAAASGSEPPVAPDSGLAPVSFNAPPEPAPAAATAPRKSMAWILWLFGGLVFALVAAVIGVAAWLMFAGAPAVSVAVVGTPTGDALRVEIPNANASDRVRFRDRELPVEMESSNAGFAVFPLEPQELEVGDNTFELVLVREEGTESVTTTLDVAYRVRADFSGLVDDNPSIAIVVHAHPGSEASVDGVAVTLDAQGRGQRMIEIAAEDTREEFARQFPYVVRNPDAEHPAEGTVDVSLPRATLELDRPGAELITEESQLDIAGAAHPDAVVSVDGEEVELVAGRFSRRIRLPSIGEYTPAVVAREPNKAPRTVVPMVRRVEDLAKEAEAYEVDRDLDYARVLQNPTTFVGRPVAMEGRVYNVSVERGESVLQLLVRDCPPTERCPLWVTYPAATDSTVNDWVRVVGVIGGEQRFRSENGDVLSVPRLDARFVLPVPVGRGRR